jgi:hypothetical protein
MSRPGNLTPGIYAALYYTQHALYSNFDAAGKEARISVTEWLESYRIVDCAANIERCLGELNFTALNRFWRKLWLYWIPQPAERNKVGSEMA